MFRIPNRSRESNDREHDLMFIAAIAIVGLALCFGVAIFLRRRDRHEQQTEAMRISVADLNNKILSREPLVILDLRHPLDVLAAPQIIPGAIPVKPDELDQHLGDLPRDVEVVLYCTCPSEETSLKVYRQLLERGFKRVKVLTGGLPAWKREKLQLQDLYPELEQQLRRQVAAQV